MTSPLVNQYDGRGDHREGDIFILRSVDIPRSSNQILAIGRITLMIGLMAGEMQKHAWKVLVLMEEYIRSEARHDRPMLDQ
jgi:hypothetical protein